MKTTKRLLAFLLTLVLLSTSFVVWKPTALAYSGSSYTRNSAMASKLTKVLNGTAKIFNNSNESLGVGDYMDVDFAYTWGPYDTWGYQCLAYARGVYYYLNGEDADYYGRLSKSSIVLKPSSKVSRLSFQVLSAAGVGCGAYVRTTGNHDFSYNTVDGHSFILLTYDEETITFLEGNSDYHGLVALKNYTWEEFNTYRLINPDRRLSYVIQPNSTKDTISAVLRILQQPESVMIDPGKKVTISVSAAGTGYLHYQWYYKSPKAGSSWTSLGSGYTNPSFSYTMADKYDGTQYYCKITDKKGSINSKAVKVTVPPKITKQPLSVAEIPGKTVTFSTAATGKGTVKYQWYYKSAKAGAEWTSLGSGYAKPSFSYTLAEKHNGVQYRCKITDNNGSIYSDVATVTVKPLPKIAKQPASVSAIPGTAVTFSVSATGTGTLRYQWYYKNAAAGSAWTSLGAKYTSASFSYTLAERHNGVQYYCKITDANGVVNSNAVKVTVLDPPKITKQPVSLSVKPGETATFSVAATGKGTVKYQWYYKSAALGSEWTSLGSSYAKSTLSYTAQEKHDGVQYYCKITDANGSINSKAVKITVLGPPKITKQPASVNAGIGTTVTFSVEATGAGTLSYQWYYKSPSSATWKSLGADYTKPSFSYKLAEKHNGVQYCCKVTDKNGSRYTKAATVTAALNITKQPASVAAAAGSAVTFSVSAVGIGEIKYQWYKSVDGGATWTKMTDYTKSSFSYKLAAKYNGVMYRCRIADDNGCQYSAAAKVTVR